MRRKVKSEKKNINLAHPYASIVALAEFAINGSMHVMDASGSLGWVDSELGIDGVRASRGAEVVLLLISDVIFESICIGSVAHLALM